MLSIASLKTISELKIQFAEILGDIGFLPTGLRRKTISKFQVWIKRRREGNGEERGMERREEDRSAGDVLESRREMCWRINMNNRIEDTMGS